MEEGAGGNLLISAQNPHAHTLLRDSIQQIQNSEIQKIQNIWTGHLLVSVFPLSHALTIVYTIPFSVHRHT